MSDWTQPLCLPCWVKEHGYHHEPHRLVHAEVETCCRCGELTAYGIYIRVDPATVPHPTREDA